MREVLEDAAKQHGRDDLMKANVNQAKQTKALLQWAKDGFPDLNSNTDDVNDNTNDINQNTDDVNDEKETADKELLKTDIVMESSNTDNLIQDSSLEAEEDIRKIELVNGGQSPATELVETIQLERHENELEGEDSIVTNDKCHKGEQNIVSGDNRGGPRTYDLRYS